MKDYKFTSYFKNEVLRKRPYLKKELCIRVVESPVKIERQENNRYRFWAQIKELNDRFLRVVTLDDKLTIHNPIVAKAQDAVSPRRPRVTL